MRRRLRPGFVFAITQTKSLEAAAFRVLKQMKSLVILSALLCCFVVSCTDCAHTTVGQQEPAGCNTQTVVSATTTTPPPVIPVATTKSGKHRITVHRQSLPKKKGRKTTYYLYWVLDSWGRWNSVTDAHVRAWQSQGYLVNFNP